MKQAYFLGALLCCAACDDELQAAALDAGVTDGSLDAHFHESAPADHEAGAHEADGHATGDHFEADATLPSTDFAAAEAVAQRGRACGTIGEGTWGADFTPGAFCTARCLVQASCEAFQSALCTFDAIPGLLGACLAACEAELDALTEPSGQCGDGATVRYEQLCDGTPDCASGEDEQHCAFMCADGEIGSGLERCDGYADCADESDEQGCATLCGVPRADVPTHEGHVL